ISQGCYLHNGPVNNHTFYFCRSMVSVNTSVHTQSIIIFIFGGTGDLTSRKLIRALYNLYLDGWMPDRFRLVGMGRTKQSDDQFSDVLLEDINKFSLRDKADA